MSRADCPCRTIRTLSPIAIAGLRRFAAEHPFIHAGGYTPNARGGYDRHAVTDFSHPIFSLPELAEAAADWIALRAYVSGGNYRLKATGRMAPWNKIVKHGLAQGGGCDALHDFAHALARGAV